MPDVSMCMAVHNAVAAVQLTWESFLKHHDSDCVKLLAHDNLSTDGVYDYLRPIAAVLTGGVDLHHGRALNHIQQHVDTKYTLIADTDLEFLEPTLDRMIGELEVDPKIGCVCFPSAKHLQDLGRCTMYGVECVSQLRIDTCLALLRTEQLVRWTAATEGGVGWDVFHDPDNHRYYDAGAKMRQAMEADGYRLVEPDWMWQAVTHFGGVATLFAIEGQGADFAAQYKDDLAIRRERYERIQERLRLLRESV